MDIVEFITKNEGKRNIVYLDSLGIKTIGVGFNLTRPDARDKITNVGADYDQVLSGSQQLTDDQINTLLSQDIANVVSDLNTIFGDITSFPDNVQLVLQDTRFNLGPNRFRGFVHFITAVKASNWTEASNQLKNSSWYHQVGQRAVTDCQLLES